MDIYRSKRKDFDAYLECQGCALTIRKLTHAEKLMMQDNPYAFVVFCKECRSEGLHIQKGFG